MKKLIKRLLLLLWFFQAWIPSHSFAEEWKGVFTTDTYPVDGCKVSSAGNTIQNAVKASSFHLKDPKNLGNTLADINLILKEYAQNNGYNAILGYTITVIQPSNSLEYPIVWAIGVPVTVKCK